MDSSKSRLIAGEKWLDDALATVERGEGRNDTGMWLAAQLRDDGVSVVEAEHCMQRFADLVPQDDHPYTPAEAHATLRSVYRRESRQPAIGLLGPPTLRRRTGREWPKLPEEALYGLPGDVVRAILPNSEADPAALLTQFMVMLGNVVDRNAHFRVEADQHYANAFLMLVGRTAKGRKGTSLNQVKCLFETAAPEWAETRIMSGLSSGEGLIHAVRDARTTQKPIRDENKRLTGDYEEVLDDPGVDDKRLLVVQTEFASVLKIMEREGNILSAILREAWDTGDLNILTKNNPTRATNAHISIIGHITAEDLKRHLKSTDTANGFANRFLWVCTERSNSLPEGGKPETKVMKELSLRVSQVLSFATGIGEVRRDEAARELWFNRYDSLSDGRFGMFGAATGRAEAQVTRLALIYAISDLSPVIRVEHLRAALAAWWYVEASARYIFGDAVGHKNADRLLAELRVRPDGLSRADMVHEIFKGNLLAVDLDEVLWLLHDLQLAYPIEETTGGRPAEIWHSMD